MERKNLILIILSLTLCIIEINAQSLTVPDLVSLAGKKDWGQVDAILNKRV
jgi:hypothetical protein